MNPISMSPSLHAALSPGARLEAARVALAARAVRAGQAGEAPPTLEFRVAQVQARVQCAAAIGERSARCESDAQSLDVLG